MTGSVFNIQRFSIHDGPGIRTTVFFKGCPARCLWCHNPESQAGTPELMVSERRCIGCGACRKICPEAVSTGRTPACTSCGSCIDICPTGARELVGRLMTPEGVLGELERDRVFFEQSGGGVTLSGGEPLAQYSFLVDILNRCRQIGFSTTLDTCGFAPTSQLLAIAPLVDLFLYDIKLMDEDRHLAMTGLSNRPIRDNLRALGAIHPNIWLRIPIVPGLTDDPDDLLSAARLAGSVPGVRQVHMLPYHRTGASKCRRLGRNDPLGAIAPPSEDQLLALAAPFRDQGLIVRIGG